MHGASYVGVYALCENLRQRNQYTKTFIKNCDGAKDWGGRLSGPPITENNRYNWQNSTSNEVNATVQSVID